MSSKRQLDGAKRIVVKVGTSTLIHPNGRINLQAIDQLSFSLSGLVNEGKQVVLVSSGAIGVGMGQMGLDARPEKIPEQQALASMGQCELMTIYQQRFTTYGQKISQVLLTHDVLDYPRVARTFLTRLIRCLNGALFRLSTKMTRLQSTNSITIRSSATTISFQLSWPTSSVRIF